MNPGRVNTSNHKIHEKISKIGFDQIPKMEIIAKFDRNATYGVFKNFTDNMETYSVAMCNKSFPPMEYLAPPIRK